MKVNYDLENSPLELKTYNTLGSNMTIEIIFLSSDNKRSGGLKIHLTSTPYYIITRCVTKYTVLSETCLTANDGDVWRVTVERFTFTETRLTLTVHCNDEKMMESEISSEKCDMETWAEHWSMETKMIKFWYSVSDLLYRHRPLPGSYSPRSAGVQNF